jgi:hypothetical protein
LYSTQASIVLVSTKIAILAQIFSLHNGGGDCNTLSLRSLYWSIAHKVNRNVTLAFNPTTPKDTLVEGEVKYLNQEHNRQWHLGFDTSNLLVASSLPTRSFIIGCSFLTGNSPGAGSPLYGLGYLPPPK